MSVSLSIKDVPEALAAQLRQRAERNHRSLQRELMAIVEAAASEPTGVTGWIVAESAAAPYVSASAKRATPASATQRRENDDGGDDLLNELDRIVAGSRWGHGTILSREQTHDGRLQRELDYEARRNEASADGPGTRPS